MLRFFISFCLAIISHLYLLQVNWDFNTTIPPQLISNSSVSVNLNSNLENQPSDSQQDSPQIDKPVESVKEVEKFSPEPPRPISEQTSEPQAVTKLEPVKPTRLIKPVAEKIKKRIEKQPTEELPEVALVVEESSSKDLAQKPAVDENKPLTLETEISKPDTNSAQASQGGPSSSTIEAQPLYQYNPKPKYPKLARRRGWEGVVMVLVEVAEDGDVASVHLHKSSGYKILDMSAMGAVKSWRFLAGTKDGRKARSTVMIPVHFKLKT